MTGGDLLTILLCNGVLLIFPYLAIAFVEVIIPLIEERKKGKNTMVTPPE